LKVVSTSAATRQGQSISRLMLDLTYRRRVLEVILDFFLIGITYYLAFLVQNRMTMDPTRLELFLDSLPVALACSYLALYVFGIYRVMWRYTGFDDLFRYFQASAGSLVLFAASIFVLESTNLTSWPAEFGYPVLLVFGVFLFLGLALSRSSFRLLDTLLQQRVRPNQIPVLIIGAGDAGEMALRWMLMNPGLNYRPVGFIDHDPLLAGRYIHGIRVLGGMDVLPALLKKDAIAD
jgi:UDP-GlcNAc:undecaprenyl-phosphate GlcNAc-1-phosphate transferase